MENRLRLKPRFRVLPLALGLLLVTSSLAGAAPKRFRLPKPPDRGNAGNRSGAASRDPLCTEVQHELTALVPEYRTTIETAAGRRFERTQVWGKTAADRPTFWFSLPYPKQDVKSVRFVLTDGQQAVYETSLPKDRSAGIVGVELPDTVVPLVEGKTYRWYLTVVRSCDRKAFAVAGEVTRVELGKSAQGKIENAELRQKFILQVENGLWYDAATTLSALLQQSPQDKVLRQQWQSLLADVDLSHLATQSFSQ